MVFVSIGKVCELLGISLSTAYRWIKSGKLIPEFRTLGNHRRFNLSQIKHNFISSSNHDNKLTVLYSRVSSHDQKQDLITQQAKLLNYAKLNNFNNIKVISDLGSGLNFKKSGLNQLLNLILTQQIKTLIINHKDRYII